MRKQSSGSQRTAKIAITIDANLLKELDNFVGIKYKNRSHAIQQAVKDSIMRLNHSRLAEECDKLNITAEQTLADEGIQKDIDEWPEY